DILKRYPFSHLQMGSHDVRYESYAHVAGHIMSAYCTSPFAPLGQDSFVLVWDGGMYPRLYFVSHQNKRVVNLGPIFHFGVNIYSVFAQHFGPFKINENVIKDELSIAGKVMAYTALGRRNQAIIDKLNQSYQDTLEAANAVANIPTYPFLFAQRLK